MTLCAAGLFYVLAVLSAMTMVPVPDYVTPLTIAVVALVAVSCFGAGAMLTLCDRAEKASRATVEDDARISRHPKGVCWRLAEGAEEWEGDRWILSLSWVEPAEAGLALWRHYFWMDDTETIND